MGVGEVSVVRGGCADVGLRADALPVLHVLHTAYISTDLFVFCNRGITPSFAPGPFKFFPGLLPLGSLRFRAVFEQRRPGAVIARPAVNTGKGMDIGGLVVTQR